jgi:hypothetical protein
MIPWNRRNDSMQTKTGYSSNPDARQAVAEAASGFSSPHGLLIMADYKRLPEISELLRERFPNTEMIGTSGTTYLNTKSSDKHLILVAFGSDAIVKAGIIRNLSSHPVTDIPVLKDKLREAGASRENSIVIEYCTNDEERLVTTIDVALSGTGVPLVGGSVFGYGANEVGRVTYNGETYTDACAYLVIHNTSGKIRVYRENIYGPYHDTKHIVTKVDLATKELTQLDGRPAAEVYSQELGISRDRIIDNVLANPFGRSVGRRIFISSQKELSSNGGIKMFKRLNVNDTISVLKLLDYRSINKETCRQISEECGDISLILSVNCIYRYLLFTKENTYGEILGNLASVGTSVGCIGGGEQFNNQHVNQTMVCAVFE